MHSPTVTAKRGRGPGQHSSHLNVEAFQDLLNRVGRGNDSDSEVARWLGVDQSTVCRIRNADVEKDGPPAVSGLFIAALANRKPARDRLERYLIFKSVTPEQRKGAA